VACSVYLCCRQIFHPDIKTCFYIHIAMLLINAQFYLHETREQNISEEILTLHQTMVQDIHGFMYPDLEDEWVQYNGMLRPYLSRLEIKRMKTFDDSAELLLTHKNIPYGHYQVLIDIFTTVQHQFICDIIKDFTYIMREQRAIEIEEENTPMETADSQFNIQ